MPRQACSTTPRSRLADLRAAIQSSVQAIEFDIILDVECLDEPFGLPQQVGRAIERKKARRMAHKVAMPGKQAANVAPA